MRSGLNRSMSSTYYAVRVGRNPGLYATWAECQAQVNKYPGSQYASFKTLVEANFYLSRSNCTKADCVEQTEVQSPSKKRKQLPDTIDLTADRISFPAPLPPGDSAYPINSNSTSLLSAIKAKRASLSAVQSVSRPCVNPSQPFVSSGVSVVSEFGSSISKHSASTTLPPHHQQHQHQQQRLASSYSSSSSSSSSSSRWRSPLLASDHHPDVRVPEENIIYTDGACSNNGKVGSKAGFGVYWSGQSHLTTYGALDPQWQQTNQRAELYAIQVAIKQIVFSEVNGPFEIRSDSSYAIQSLTDWCHKWHSTNWTYPVKNLDIVRATLDLAEDFLHDSTLSTIDDKRILLRHIRGHSGERGNEEADKLAVMGSKL